MSKKFEHPNEYRDKADLFDFATYLACPGTVHAAWWEAFPDAELPNGGRAAETPQEAEEFIRLTRLKAIEAGLWPSIP